MDSGIGDENNTSFSSELQYDFIKDDKNEKLITYGECSRFYLYLLGATICKLISILILGGLKDNTSLFGFSPILNSYGNIQSIYTYIGFIIFSFIFRCIFKKNERKFNQKRKALLIHNNKSKQNFKKLYFQIFLVSFCFGFYSEALNILYGQGFQLLNYWTFETIFTFILIRKYFSFDVYSHHKCSIYFIVITCSIFLLIASLIPNSYGEEEKLNTYQFVKKKLGSYYYSIIFILFFIFLSFVFAYSRTYSKVLMQIKSVSYYTLIFSIGIIGLLITIISYIILYNINAENNILQYFSDLNSCDRNYKFYLEIFLIYPIFIFVKFMQIYFEILIIYYLNPIYTLVTNNLTYGSIKVVSFVSNNSANFINFIFSQLSEDFAIIGYIFYLEILELNFCRLSDNIKKKIKSKGENEFNEIYNFRVKTLDVLSIEEDEGENQNNFVNNKIFEMNEKRSDENE